MRKRMAVLMIPLLLLVGCGEREKKPEDVFASFREQLTAAESVSAQARLTADAGGTAEEYALAVSCTGGDVTVTVTEPELIAGITATLREGQTDISYDGVMLGVGAVDPEGTTPVSAAPAILRAMREGFAELYWQDGSLAAARFYTGESAACTVWIDPEGLVPVAAEIVSDGRTAITCRFTDWTMRAAE